MNIKSPKLKELTVGYASKNNTVIIDYVSIEGAELTLRALNHPLRRQILEFINIHGSVRAAKMSHMLKGDQSGISKQIGILRRAGIIQPVVKGHNISYSVNIKRIDEVMKLARELDQKNYDRKLIRVLRLVEK